MTQPTRRQAFERAQPKIVNAEVQTALDAGHAAISFAGEPVMISKDEIGFIALKFAVLDGDTRVVLLDQFAARVLQRLLDTANKADWKTKNLPTVFKAQKD
jgi:hypothetical protein